MARPLVGVHRGLEDRVEVHEADMERLPFMEPAIREVIAAWDGFRAGDGLVMPGSIGVASGRR